MALEGAAAAASLALGYSACSGLSLASGACASPSHVSMIPLIVLLPAALWLVHAMRVSDLPATERSRRRFSVTVLVTVALATVDLVIRPEVSTLVLPAVVLGFALFLPNLCAGSARKWLGRKGLWGAPVLILGAGDTGARVARSLRDHPELGFTPIGFVDDDPRKWRRVIDEVPVVGPLSFSETDEAKERTNTVVVAIPNLPAAQTADLVERLPYPTVLVVPNLDPMGRAWRSATDLGGIYAVEIKKKLLLRRFLIAKRVLDYLIAVPIFLISIPLITFFGLWIKVVSRGPVFFRQERFGLDGRRFQVIKLRTMLVDAEERLEAHLKENPEASREWYANYKLKKDPRVLPVIGEVLRMTSLDELPQAWNILRGDMSVVGPRPFTAYHLDSFDERFRTFRQCVRPGLTGLWQVESRSNGDTDDQKRLDMRYLHNWSLWLDVTLVFRTVWAVLRARGAY